MTQALAADIRRPEAIDAAWMAQVLKGAGIDAAVASVEAKPIGTGQTGECMRFVIHYADDGAPGPRSLIGKFPSSDPASCRAGMAGGDYVREVRFYRDLALTTDVAAPRCYLAELDADSGAFVLLLEDLSPARQGDQLAGVTLDQARLVVEEAAKLHAPYWGDPRLAEIDWIKQTTRSTTKLPAADVVMKTCEGFTERYAGQLTDHAVTACRRYAERVDHYRAIPRKFKTIAHYDFRPDNMMFATPEGGHAVTVLDWQTLSWAAGADDLAYFLAGALPAETLRAHEPELLQLYLDALISRGVKDYTMADLERDYAIGAFRLLATGMGGAMAVVRTARGDRMFIQMVNAAAQHIRDHCSLAYLD
ncbi:phosphotransferase [Sphingobium tyrosinilyticum]|uniref:Phosphotransferase n=1 Tax=Sphingobium tyrosinilyticum TaxID=2715436 RepID=A0ABV9F1C0_9SPHN